MRIKDFSWSHTVGKKPEVELYLTDVTSDELTALRDLAIHRDRIRIESKEDPKPSPVRPITTNDYVFSNDYVRRYEEMAAALNDYRSRVYKNEFTSRDIKVEKVIFNNPATIVFWSDNTKTVVVCGKNDTYDKEKGFFIACAKKLFGNDYKAVGRMNKAIEMAEDKNG